MKSPCYKCLIKPSCRNKEFKPLVNECKVIFNFIWPKEFHKCNKATTILLVENDLKPIPWHSSLDEESGNVSIIEKKPFEVVVGMIVERSSYDPHALYRE